MRTYPLSGPGPFQSPFFGQAVPLRTAPASRPLPLLGQAADGALDAAREDLERAEGYLVRIGEMYGDLVALVGATKAMTAVGQARDAVERARRAYHSAMRLSEMGGGPRV